MLDNQLNRGINVLHWNDAYSPLFHSKNGEGISIYY